MLLFHCSFLISRVSNFVNYNVTSFLAIGPLRLDLRKLPYKLVVGSVPNNN